jgi:2-polyprenyl-3-methyl-5-hydroxy-6-metoxy-1,4-benzoquinol methylase
MSPLRERLIEKYADHYARVNVDVDPTSMDFSTFRSTQLTFGPALNGLVPGAKIADVGCGTGFLLYWLTKQPGIVPVGVDASRSQVEVLRKHLPGVEVHCEDGLAFMKERPNTFDVIFCIDVLEHIADEHLLDWVETAHGALKTGGRFVCRTPNAANLKASHARYIDLTHYRCFTSHSICQLLSAGGFADCQILSVRAGDVGSRVRMVLEQYLHRAVYRVCGNSEEQFFTSNIVAMGTRR